MSVVLAVGFAHVPGASADTSGSSTTTDASTTPTTDGSTTTTVGDPLASLPPAPADFAGQFVGVYQSAYATAAALGQAESLPRVDQFQSQLDSAGPEGLAALYSVVQQTPQWSQLPGLMQAIAAQSNGSPSATLSSASSGGAASSVQLMSVVEPSATSPTTGAVLLDAPVTTFTEAPCDTPHGPDTIRDAQLAFDIATGIYNGLAVAQASIPEAPPFSEIAKAVLAVIMIVAALIFTAASIVRDVYNRQNADAANKCSSFTDWFNNVDNTTVQTYYLLKSVTGALAQLKSTNHESLTLVQEAQSSLTDLQNTFDQTLTNDSDTIQQTLGGNAQTLITNIQDVQTALNQTVTLTQQSQGSAGQSVGAAVDKETATIQTALSGGEDQVLHEIDETARNLTALVTQSNQQIMNALQANFTTTQSEFYADLKRRIERALATGVPQVQLKLPTAMGGFLNSTPVGVQEVVNDDIHALQSLGATIAPSVIANLNAANAAVSAGKWLSAFANFMKAYQAFASA